MSPDDDLERLLRGYRPVGPPAGLRSRIVERLAAERARSARSWLLPAAAAAAVLVLYALGANARREAMPPFEAQHVERQMHLNELTTTLGGDAIAREAAEHLVSLEEQVVRAERERGLSADVEGVSHE
jgi:hypothetical protein